MADRAPRPARQRRRCHHRRPGQRHAPLLSPDGGQLVYGTHYEQQTGLRIRDLNTGRDRWLVYPVQREEQESGFTRDLLPAYAFVHRQACDDRTPSIGLNFQSRSELTY